jgi:hypothetical protein
VFIALALAGCESVEAEPEASPDEIEQGQAAQEDFMVERYCSYGAVSESQLQGCIDHVGLGQVDSLDTNAAQYGRLEIDECLSDGGPFCVEGQLDPPQP